MKLICFFCFFSLAAICSAQHPLQAKKANLLLLNKPYQIVYRDTLYKGAKEFKQLFFRTGDVALMDLYDRHQSNKITGTVLNTIGGFALTFGVIYATGNGTSNQKSSGWILAGSGLASSIVGTLLLAKANENLMQATQIFNNKYALAGVGITSNGIGLRIHVK
jgi:hypothetical protein